MESGEAPPQSVVTLEQRKLQAEIDSLEASRRKALAEAQKAEYEVAELKKRKTVLERILSTAQFSVLLAFGTLIFQIWQVHASGKAAQEAEQSKQWNDTLSHISFAGDETSLGSALASAAFLKTPRYRADAAKVMIDILPYIKDSTSLSTTFDKLLVDGQEKDAYEVATRIGDHYRDDASVPRIDGKIQPVQLPSLCDADLADVLRNSPYNLDDDDKLVTDADLRDNQVDALTRTLVKDWRKRYQKRSSWGVGPTSPDHLFLRIGELPNRDVVVDLSALNLPKAHLEQAYLCKVKFMDADLEGAWLRGSDMKYSDMTQTHLEAAHLERADLNSAVFTGAHLDGAFLDGADLGSVTQFDGSNWSKADWWNAAKISSPLCQLLKASYTTSATTKSSQEAAAKVCPVG